MKKIFSVICFSLIYAFVCSFLAGIASYILTMGYSPFARNYSKLALGLLLMMSIGFGLLSGLIIGIANLSKKFSNSKHVKLLVSVGLFPSAAIAVLIIFVWGLQR
jgi:hypothetical protein